MALARPVGSRILCSGPFILRMNLHLDFSQQFACYVYDKSRILRVGRMGPMSNRVPNVKRDSQLIIQRPRDHLTGARLFEKLTHTYSLARSDAQYFGEMGLNRSERGKDCCIVFAFG